MSANTKNLKSAHFSRLILVLFVIVFGAIGAYILITSNAAPAPPTVYTTTPASFMPVNNSFSVQIRENSSTTTVNAVQANLSYPTSLLTLVSVDLTGSAFTTAAQNTSGGGSIQLGLGTCGGCAAVSGDQLVATLNFKTNVTGGAAAVAFTSGTLLVSSTTNTDLLGGLGATAGFTVNVDTTAPTVSITSPANGSTVSAGSTNTVSATASDADRVVSVDIYVDGTKVTTLSNSPYNYSWNTTGLSLGSHTLQAKAVDPSGNLGSSAINTVTVADTTPPTASITSPTNGSTVKGTVNVNSTAADNAGGTGVNKVELYVDGVLKLTDTVAPYSFAWDSTTATNASHALTVKAYDNAAPANTVTSSAVTVTVDNSAPTTPASFRTTGNSLNSITLAWNASTDNVGVTGYVITRNGTTITTTSGATLTYTDSGLASGTSYNYTIAAIDGIGNSSATSPLTASTIAAKIGDLNNDTKVDGLDLSILLSKWGTSDPTADINRDTKVDVLDLSALLSHWAP